LNVETKKTVSLYVTAALGYLAIAACILINPVNRFLSGLLLMCLGIAIYLYLVFQVADKNWLDVRAVFAGVWMFTTGLSALRLLDYQKPWEHKTWMLLAATFILFLIGSDLGIRKGIGIFHKVSARLKKIRVGKIRFQMRENRLFLICIVSTLIGLGCFVINIAIKGFIPCFSTIHNAYMLFYTRWHVFAVAATGVAGLCYYCIRTQKLCIWKKVILYVCIFYHVFLFPVMVVSRGVFVTAALSLAVTVFYLHRKRLIPLLLCLIVILGVYLLTSQLRNYSDKYLEDHFEPSDIIISPDASPDHVEDSESEELHFSLSPKMAFLYGYLTVGFDNFNEAVKNTVGYTFGVRQLLPMNVILRLDWVDKISEAGEFYQVRPHLTTVNLIGQFYYDFHEIGVLVFVLLWAFLFGMSQRVYEEGKGPISLMVLGNTMVPVTLCFFSAWLSNFTQWMLWGVAILIALAASVTLRGEGTNSVVEKEEGI